MSEEKFGGFTKKELQEKFIGGLKIESDGRMIIDDKDLSDLIKNKDFRPDALLDRCNTCTNNC